MKLGQLGGDGRGKKYDQNFKKMKVLFKSKQDVDKSLKHWSNIVEVHYGEK